MSLHAGPAHSGSTRIPKRYCIGLIACGVLVLIGIVVGSLILLSSHSEEVLRWQRECADYTLPADCVVYEQDPKEAAGLLSKGEGYAALYHFNDPKHPAAVHTAPCWYELQRSLESKSRLIPKEAREVGEALAIGKPLERTTGILFLHERCSRAGTRCIVAVQVEPSTRQFPRASLAFICRSRIVISSRFSQRWTTTEDSDTFGRKFTDGVNGGSLRFYAGQPDPVDASRFTIKYLMLGEPGTIDGRLQDDGGLRLSIRDDPEAKELERSR